MISHALLTQYGCIHIRTFYQNAVYMNVLLYIVYCLLYVCDCNTLLSSVKLVIHMVRGKEESRIPFDLAKSAIFTRGFFPPP